MTDKGTAKVSFQIRDTVINNNNNKYNHTEQ